METNLQILIQALGMGSLWTMGALATDMILRAIGRVHMALGHWFVLSALSLAWIRDKLPHASVSVLLLVAFGAGAILGYLSHPRFLWQGMGEERSREGFFLFTLGGALVLEFLMQNLFPLPGVPVGTGSIQLGEKLFVSTGVLWAIVSCVAIVMCVWAFLRKAKMGLALRAWDGGLGDLTIVGANPASLGRGIGTVSVGLVFLSGALAGSIHSINFHEGLFWTTCFLLIAVVSRGLRPLEVLTMGWAMGLGEAIVSQTMGPKWQASFPPLLLLVVLGLTKGRNRRVFL